MQPRHVIPFYANNPDIFDRLIHGYSQKVPEEIVPLLKGVKVIEEEVKTSASSTTKTRSKSKDRKRKSHDTKTLSSEYLEVSKQENSE